MRHAVQLGGKIKVTIHLHLTVQRRCFRQETNPGFGLRGLAGQVETAYFNLPRMRRQRAGEHLQRGALARTVVTEQAKHLTMPKFQRHPMDNLALAEAAVQVACGQGWRCCVGHALLCSRVVMKAKYNLICASLKKLILQMP